MYPQCKLSAVKAAVCYYALQLDPIQCERTKKCLEILKFSMGNMMVSFLDKYYKYGVDPDPDRRELTIRGFESAFLANLEASYIFDKLKHIWERHVRFLGTYCDDEIIVFNGQKSNKWLLNWLRIFQGEVDRLLKTYSLQRRFGGLARHHHHCKNQKYQLKVLAPSTAPVSTEITHSPTSTSKSHGMTKEGPTSMSTKSRVNLLSISTTTVTTTAATRQQSSLV
jgi:hypothetical protein